MDLADQAILSITVSKLDYLLPACPQSLILSFLMKATDLFQHCIPYLYLTSPKFLYIDISVYRHKNLLPVDVDISGVHCNTLLFFVISKSRIE